MGVWSGLFFFLQPRYNIRSLPEKKVQVWLEPRHKHYTNCCSLLAKWLFNSCSLLQKYMYSFTSQKVGESLGRWPCWLKLSATSSWLIFQNKKKKKQQVDRNPGRSSLGRNCRGKSWQISPVCYCFWLWWENWAQKVHADTNNLWEKKKTGRYIGGCLNQLCQKQRWICFSESWPARKQLFFRSALMRTRLQSQWWFCCCCQWRRRWCARRSQEYFLTM